MEASDQTSEQEATQLGAEAPPAGADVSAPPEPSAEQSTNDLLRQIIEEQQQHRAEVADLRKQIEAGRQVMPAPSATPLSPEERLAERMNDIAQHPYYCPGCGLLYDYPQRCTGKPESPHQPIEVVSTDELKTGDPKQHTVAPSTDVPVLGRNAY